MNKDENINERVRSEWIDETDGFDRVRDVMRNTTEPLTAHEVADSAKVSTNTARKHLDRLADMNQIGTDERGNTTLYFRDESRERMERVREISRKYTEEEIEERIRGMTDEIHEYREKYGCEEPEDLVVEMDEDADTELWNAIADWKTTRANLAVAKAALAFKRVPARSGDDGPRAEV
ncbi:MAG: ArsR family transcriptional regulator [Halobacteriales archaeon]|nr:ArsR family transcriptional regulator [Halobacteriales archaeon]